MKPLADLKQRRRAVFDLDRCLLVEAGAGTGKTTLLVDRLVQLLSCRTEIFRLAAITFTEKAAAELKLRLRDRLEERAEEARAEGDRECEDRCESALACLDRAAVTTIHGFCAALLRERPVEARIDPGFEVADAERQRLVFEEAFSEFLSTLFEEESAALEEAFTAGLRLRPLSDLCRALIEQRDLLADPELRVDTSPPPGALDPTALLGPFQELVEFLEAMRGACRNPDEDRLVPLIDELSALARTLVAQPLEEQERILLAYQPKSPNGAQKNWTCKTTLAEAKDRIRAFKALHEARTSFESGRRASALLSELKRLPDFYERAKRRHGVLDFQDLLIKTRDLLLFETEVRRDFQRRFDTILLDEFQDTDPLQAEIACLLAEDPESGPAKSWRDVSLGPGRLFLVGDPKQSIYRFRRADIEVYEQVREIVLRSGGARLKIQVNFRSSPALLGWVNRRFERLIQPPESGGAYQPEYVGIEPAPGAEDLGAGVQVLCDPGRQEPYDSADVARQAEARHVAAFLRFATEGPGALLVHERRGGETSVRPARLSDCALLFRTTTALPLYEEALRSREIPYRVFGGKHLYSRAEVKALVALLRTLSDPTDDIAQVAVLRSPLFGISDDELAAFRMAGGRFDSLGRDPEGTPPALRQARELLRALWQRSRESGVAAFVTEALERTRALELFLLKPMGEQRVANLRRFVDLARALEAAGRCTLRSFVNQVRERERDGLEEEESALVAGAGEAVQIMTIHKSKGLEFPIVVLCDPCGEGRAGGDLVCRIGPPPRVEFRLARQALQTPGFVELSERDRLLEDAERRRLLYVACTRACDHLVLPRFPFGKPKPMSSFHYLADDDRFGAPAPAAGAAQAAQATWFVPRQDLDLEIREARPFRLDLDVAAPGGPAEIQDRMEERERFRRALGERFAGPRHRRRIGSATSCKSDVPLPSSGRCDAGDGLRGKAFGTLVHQLLERVDYAREPRDLEALAGHLAARLELDGSAAAPAARLVKRFLDSDLAARIRAAPRRLPEVPFVFRSVDEGDEGEDGERGVLYEGAIDLLVEEADGKLLVVDFKTDDVEGTALAERAAFYAGQCRLYARAVLAATGRPVDESLLAFLRAGRMGEVIRLDEA